MPPSPGVLVVASQLLQHGVLVCVWELGEDRAA